MIKNIFNPATIKKHPVALAFMVICLIFPFVISRTYFTRVLMEVFFFAALGNAWNIIGGYGKQTSWASSIFFSIGAYTTIILFAGSGQAGGKIIPALGISPWISVWLGIALALLLAVVIGWPCFRLRGVFFSIATIACTTIFRQLLIYFERFTGGSLGLTFKIRSGNTLWGLHFDTDLPYYFVAFIWMIITTLIVVYIDSHKLGYYLRAICEDQDAAESLGMKSQNVKLKAFLISSAMMAFTGMLYVFKTGFADPNTLASQDMSVRIGIVAILGGMGTIWGPLVGALISIPLLELSNAYLQDLGGGGAGWALYGLLIVVMVLFKPNGIVSIVEDIKAKYFAKKTVGGDRIA
ncbi:branched-chain amino acid ABC transporter permease [Caproiciproducens faecalis]|uniref:Branched-chain amino acid ABC transporter permease n=1 Tax=Caproiciproducens faecalis TaxID=2820301 RepID=A0ABS7DL77_9FIRM|nr:branched-chain amino acid ABC transporter permease [Caproiciproducens faecalis]MBW7572051.1 branched-chain amino acid ABC transporter permease [Caproiciproducens faecalis]